MTGSSSSPAIIREDDSTGLLELSMFLLTLITDAVNQQVPKKRRVRGKDGLVGGELLLVRNYGHVGELHPLADALHHITE